MVQGESGSISPAFTKPQHGEPLYGFNGNELCKNPEEAAEDEAKATLTRYGMLKNACRHFFPLLPHSIPSQDRGFIIFVRQAAYVLA